MQEKDNVPEKGALATTPAKKSVDEVKALLEQTAKSWSAYLAKDMVSDFSAVPVHAKLAIMQTLPKDCIEYRTVGSSQVPYIKHETAEKALNFAFNFRVDTEIMRDGGQEITVNGKKCYEATVQVKFTFTLPDGSKITRAVYSGHRLYDNAATTKADAYKSALSKAYTIVARSFGIGSNFKDGKTITPIAKAEADAYEQVAKETPPHVTKSFAKDDLPY